MDNEILDIKSAAAFLGFSKSHLSNVLNGRVSNVPQIPHVKVGRRLILRRSVLVKWIEERERDSVTVPAKPIASKVGPVEIEIKRRRKRP